MGATTFFSAARRKGYTGGPTEEKRDWPDAQTAFEHLTADSRYESGHSYSGEIGMKRDFVHIATVKTDGEALALADKLIADCDPRVDDKWGPAGCIIVERGDIQFLFFGWASS